MPAIAPLSESTERKAVAACAVVDGNAAVINDIRFARNISKAVESVIHSRRRSIEYNVTVAVAISVLAQKWLRAYIE
jgi:uncharacterized protein (UPF0147 family)